MDNIFIKLVGMNNTYSSRNRHLGLETNSTPIATRFRSSPERPRMSSDPIMVFSHRFNPKLLIISFTIVSRSVLDVVRGNRRRALNSNASRAVAVGLFSWMDVSWFVKHLQKRVFLGDVSNIFAKTSWFNFFSICGD